MPDRTRNIHERFLRHVWSRQYLDPSRLRTCDGQSVTVIEVGRLNLDGGPDFADAKIRIGSTTFVGDVEIHRTIADWYSHQHQTDARYNRVVLHVVLEADAHQRATTSLSGRNIPVLVLSDFLPESIQSIWQKAILDERARKSETIRCFRQNDAVTETVLAGWLQKLATERLELKLRRFEERLKDLAYQHLMTVREHPRTYGDPPVEGHPDEIPPPFEELTQRDYSSRELWEQVLYEGLMEGLGYSKNRDPFLRLARSVTLAFVRELGVSTQTKKREALLFAVAGLLPRIRSLKERESKEYVRVLIREWNNVRSTVHRPKLNAADWQFFPTRPGNFPTLRIAAANVLVEKLLNDDLFRTIVQSLKNSDDPEETRKALVGLFSVQTDTFWNHHYDFDHATQKPTTALGISRINDLLVNTAIPVALLYARIFKESRIREHTLKVYDSFPPTNDNTLTRLMERQLVRKRVPLDTASRQQAVIQLYKYYCTENRCDECEIGKISFLPD